MAQFSDAGTFSAGLARQIAARLLCGRPTRLGMPKAARPVTLAVLFEFDVRDTCANRLGHESRGDEAAEAMKLIALVPAAVINHRLRREDAGLVFAYLAAS